MPDPELVARVYGNVHMEHPGITKELVRQVIHDRNVTDLVAEARRLTSRCPPGPYEVWDGCSWRRIGPKGGSESDAVCYPTNHPYDRHPDIEAKPGVLELFAWSRTGVEQLCDLADSLQSQLAAVTEERDRLRRSASENSPREPGW